MTQQERILDYIDRHGSITPMDAFLDLGITKLATRVSELIRGGVRIEKTQKSGKNRFGETVHFMEYRRDKL